MKVQLTINGPVVGSDVVEIVDVESYFGLDPSSPDIEKELDECVADWTQSFYSYGWTEVDDSEEVTDG